MVLNFQLSVNPSRISSLLRENLAYMPSMHCTLAVLERLHYILKHYTAL
jgi:hypothetical protein